MRIYMICLKRNIKIYYSSSNLAFQLRFSDTSIYTLPPPFTFYSSTIHRKHTNPINMSLIKDVKPFKTGWCVHVELYYQKPKPYCFFQDLHRFPFLFHSSQAIFRHSFATRMSSGTPPLTTYDLHYVA